MLTETIEYFRACIAGEVGGSLFPEQMVALLKALEDGRRVRALANYLVRTGGVEVSELRGDNAQLWRNLNEAEREIAELRRQRDEYRTLAELKETNATETRNANNRLVNENLALASQNRALQMLARSRQQEATVLASKLTACKPELLDSERAANEKLTNELEQYQLRLAGALTAAEGHEFDQSTCVDYVRDCPTVAAVLKLRRNHDDMAFRLRGLDK